MAKYFNRLTEGLLKINKRVFYYVSNLKYFPFNRLTLKKGQKLSKSVKMLLNVT